MSIIQKLSMPANSNVIFGIIGSRQIHITLSAQTLNFIPAGTYNLMPPIYDPVYGVIVMMTRVGGAALGGTAQGKFGGTPMFDIEMPGAAAAMKWEGSGASSQKMEFGGNSPGGSQAFALSDKLIPGRNSIVVTTGFSDLVEALQGAGGASLAVTG